MVEPRPGRQQRAHQGRVAGREPARTRAAGAETEKQRARDGTDGLRNLGRAGSTPDGKDAARDDTPDSAHPPGALRSFPILGD
jgi:hypothetical protein